MPTFEWREDREDPELYECRVSAEDGRTLDVVGGFEFGEGHPMRTVIEARIARVLRQDTMTELLP